MKIGIFIGQLFASFQGKRNNFLILKAKTINMMEKPKIFAIWYI